VPNGALFVSFAESDGGHSYLAARAMLEPSRHERGRPHLAPEVRPTDWPPDHVEDAADGSKISKKTLQK
jgi:hypothetical protein